MIETTIIIVLGVGLIGAVYLLLKVKVDPGVEVSEYRTITFDWKDPSQPKGGKIYANPEILDVVKDFASVVFVNLTKQEIKIVFDENDTDYDSPFSVVKTISLEAAGASNESAKPFPITVKISDGNKLKIFPYHVEPDGPPETEQSPRIRIGPKTVIDNL